MTHVYGGAFLHCHARGARCVCVIFDFYYQSALLFCSHWRANASIKNCCSHFCTV